MDILKPGGNLIIVSQCSEGLGSAEYVDAQQRLIDLGPDGFLESLLPKKFADVDEWQTEMQLKPMRLGPIHLFSSGLSEEEWALTGVSGVRNLMGEIEQAIYEAGDKKIAIIPEGPYVIPLYDS